MSEQVCQYPGFAIGDEITGHGSTPEEAVRRAVGLRLRCETECCCRHTSPPPGFRAELLRTEVEWSFGPVFILTLKVVAL